MWDTYLFCSETNYCAIPTRAAVQSCHFPCWKQLLLLWARLLGIHWHPDLSWFEPAQPPNHDGRGLRWLSAVGDRLNPSLYLHIYLFASVFACGRTLADTPLLSFFSRNRWGLNDRAWSTIMYNHQLAASLHPSIHAFWLTAKFIAP